MALEFGWRTGSVDLLDWDEALIRGFGAREDITRELWYLPLDGIFVPVDGREEPVQEALVVYKRPEPTQITATLPMIAVIRDTIQPAEARLLTTVQSYRLPAEGGVPISAGGSVGWSFYETKDKEQPYDLHYTIECWARYRSVAQMLLCMVMRRYPHRGTITVTDGINNPRVYAVYQQGTSDLTEVASLTERVCGFSLSLRVEAELTLDKEPIVVPAFTGTQSNTPLLGGGVQLVPGPGGYGLVPADANGLPIAGPGAAGQNDPDPGPGGRYGTGSPIIRTGIVGG